MKRSLWALAAVLVLPLTPSISAGDAPPAETSAARPFAHVLSAAGQWLEGPAEIASGALRMGAVSVPVEQIVVLRWPIPAAETIDQALVLQSGDVLGGVVQSLQADKLVFASDHFGMVAIPVSQVLAVVLAPQSLATLAAAAAEAPGAVLVNGDQLAGTPSFINDQAVGINNGRRIIDVPRERTALVRLARVASAPAKGVTQFLRLAGGDLISGTVKALTSDTCEIATAFAGTVKLPAALIAEMWSEGGPLTPLATAKPSLVKQIAQFDESFPFRVDRSVLGGFLTVGGQRAERGLGCHARAEVSYALDGSYAALVAEVGIDAAAGPCGDAAFQVFVDGKVAFNQAARGGAAAHPLCVPLAGAKLLQLVVDFGADGNASGDHADWCWPVLVKGVAPAKP